MGAVQGTQEVKAAIEDLTTLVKDNFEKYQEALAAERKEYEAMLEQKASGKDFGEAKERLEKIEKATSEFEEKCLKEIADLKMSASNVAPQDKEEEIKSAFFEHMRTGKFERLSEKQQDLLAAEIFEYGKKCMTLKESSVEEVKGMLAGRVPDGGNLVVPPVISNSIVRMMEEDTALYRLSSSVDIASSTYKRPAQLSKAEAKWVDETTPWEETNTAQYGEVKIDVHTLMADPKVSQILIEDGAIDIEKEVLASVREAFSDMTAKSFLYGNGDNKPLGLLNYPLVAEIPNAKNSPKRKWGQFGYIATGKAGDLRPANFEQGISPIDDLISMTGCLKRGYLKNAVWLMNKNTATTLRKLKDKNGNFIWELSLEKGIPFELLGYPVEYEAYMPDISETDKCPIAFGDFGKSCLVVRRRGMNMIRDPYTHKGQVMFATSTRLGFGVQDFNGIIFLKTSVN